MGVTIDYQLKFDAHISNICKKASRQLHVLNKRIGKNLTKLGRLTIYYSFIMSNFNYCPVIWHFCGECNTRKIEKIQERALRFIYEDYCSTYEQLLIKSKLPSLEIRRIRMIAIEVYKIINKQCPLYLHELIEIKKCNYSFRNNNIADVPRVRTTTHGLHSFRYAGAKLWNELPNKMREEMPLGQFKSVVGNWEGSLCQCSSCRSQ